MAVVSADQDETGRRTVGQALAGATTELLAVIPTSTEPDDPIIAVLAERLSSVPELALTTSAVDERVDVESGAPRVAGGRDLIRRLAGLLAAERSRAAMPVVVLRVDAARSVGGFDPSLPGLGWTDLIERLRRVGQVGHLTEGPGDRLPFIDHLHAGLDAAEQIRSEGRWLMANGSADAPITAARYRRAVLLAVGSAGGRGADRLLLRRVADDARRWWRGPAPHEEQVGIGRRADWRFLLADRPRRHLLILDGPDSPDPAKDPDRWRWLVDDGWVDRVSTSIAAATEDGADQPDRSGQAIPTVPPDVVYVGLGASTAAGLAAAGPSCAVVIEHGRSPVERRQGLQAIRAAGGFDEVHRVLVTPDLDGPKRFVPLGVDGGLDWLLGGPPKLPEHGRSFSRSVTGHLRAAAVDVAAKATGSAAADLMGAALGPGLLIATRGDEPVAAVLSKTGGSVLVTSGHDEGSRVVLIPVGPESPRGPGGVAVTKIAPRPGYNGNIDAELARVRTLQGRIAASGNTTIDGLLPTVDGPFDRGPLRSSTESYAGRWTASDLCYRMPETRDEVLQRVIEAIDQFSMATIREHLTWSPDHFERRLGSLFDRYEELVGPDRSLDRLRRILGERSDLLNGTVIPLADRHFDLGPWNVVIGPDSAMTIIDWELGPPRSVDQAGLAGGDQLYFIKYWLHIAMGLRSVDEELTGFLFLAPDSEPDDPRHTATTVFAESLDRLGIPAPFVPLLTAHIWLEAGLHTIERRRASGIESGSPGRYLTTVARHGDRLLDFWPAAP